MEKIVKISQFKTLAMIAPAIIFAHSVQAGNWSLGASVLASSSPYLGTKNNIYPAPIINYEGDDFYFRTLMAGYNLWKDKQNQLSLIVYYSPLHFSAGDSDDQRMKQLNKRRSTLMAGASYSYNADWGTLRTTLSADTLNNSNGLIADLAYLYRFSFDAWSFVPGIGVTGNSENHNKYYYGINSDESRRSSFNRYTPSGSVSPYIELSTRYEINKDWNAFFTGRYVSLGNDIKDSPMVGKSYTSLLWAGATYRF